MSWGNLHLKEWIGVNRKGEKHSKQREQNEQNHGHMKVCVLVWGAISGMILVVSLSES